MKTILFDPVQSPYLVPFDGSFRVADAATAPPKSERDKKQNRKALDDAVKRLRKLQRKLYADDRFAVLLVFQAMDAAGKDGTIRAVMTGVNPAGCQVFSFKQPSSLELDHDFLWRIHRRLPERGRIGIFNRSHYEEVLVVRVHPRFLANQKLPPRVSPFELDAAGEDGAGAEAAERLDELWRHRLRSIRGFERHLAHNGTVVIKFWLNVSKDEQRKRLLARIDEPDSNWKFAASDLHEREHWDEYMRAYEHALVETSRPWAPWYAIPADNKPYMRQCVAQIVVDTLAQLDIAYPEPSDADREEMLALRSQLEHQE